MENDFLTDEIKPERPTFLKVLCILTFIGSGWAFLSSSYAYFNADKLIDSNTQTTIRIKTDSINTKKQGDTIKTKFAAKLMNVLAIVSKPENIRKKSIGDFVAAVFCLFGAFLMWKLKRKGFYLYLIGTIIGIALPFYLFGNNFVSVAQAAIVGFFGVLFIIFYAMNLKSMQ